MGQLPMWITFHAEQGGDIERVMKVLKGWNLGELQLPPEKSRGFVHTFYVQRNPDHTYDYVRDTMRSLGVYLLEIRLADRVWWHHSAYDDPDNFSAGDQKIRKRREKKNKERRRRGVRKKNKKH